MTRIDSVAETRHHGAGGFADMRDRIRLAAIVGTRPEAIKLAAIALEAASDGRFDLRLIATGQHEAMVHDALAPFGLAAAETLRPNPHADHPDTAVLALQDAIAASLAADRPDMLIVQGDTNSAYAGALAAAEQSIPFAHVEAGLRSYDLANPFPEERNRVAIDRLADLLLAPTPEAAANLAADRHARGETVITGNTGVDALRIVRETHPPFVAGPRPLLLVTCHRRESIGDGLAGICLAVERLAARGDVDLLLPLHPNPAVRGQVSAALLGVERVVLIEPLPYPAMVGAMAAARLILTDSGGVQEEATTLGTPCLVLRDVTERPEGLASRNLALVGTDPGRIVAAATRLLDDPAARAAMAVPADQYGDGRAAPRVLAAIRAWLHRRNADAPAVAFAAPEAQRVRPRLS